MLALLGGHPHAVSLAAPLLEHNTLTQLYRKLANNIMDCLDNYGAVTRNASLRASLDASLE